MHNLYIGDIYRLYFCNCLPSFTITQQALKNGALHSFKVTEIELVPTAHVLPYKIWS